jgi:hypothetical protein
MNQLSDRFGRLLRPPFCKVSLSDQSSRAWPMPRGRSCFSCPKLPCGLLRKFLLPSPHRVLSAVPVNVAWMKRSGIQKLRLLRRSATYSERGHPSQFQLQNPGFLCGLRTINTRWGETTVVISKALTKFF